MSSFLIAVIFGAGAGALVYSQLGKRIGYGNDQGVWKVVLFTAVIVTVMVFILLSTVVSL